MRQSRSTLDLSTISDDFLSHTFEEEPALARVLAKLGEDGTRSLGGVLGRFDRRREGKLDARGRLLARRILLRLRKPTARALVLTNRILDYLDFDRDSLLSDHELEVCVAILEAFSKADSPNDTLSEYELEMLYAVLRNLDHDDSGSLDGLERQKLLDSLKDPETFIMVEMATNPRLREVMTGPV